MLADTEGLFKRARQGSDAFQQAAPFPWLLVPGMIKKPCCAALFEGLRQYAETGRPPENFYPLVKLPAVVQMLLWELSSSTLIRHFASLAGTPPLLPDPFLTQGGFLFWKEPSVLHSAAGEFVPRHPQTDLQNILRLEIFFAANPAAEFSLELLDEDNQVIECIKVGTGSLLITGSERYRLRYVVAEPEQWASLLSYYYINDRARILNGQEQPRAY
jgi:hypothetical protein